MLIKIGGEIINTNQLIYAEYVEKDSKPSLYLRLGGGGAREISYTARTYKGETARSLWQTLVGKCDVEIAHDEEADDGASQLPIVV